MKAPPWTSPSAQGELATRGPLVFIADETHDAVRVLDTRMGNLFVESSSPVRRISTSGILTTVGGGGCPCVAPTNENLVATEAGICPGRLFCRPCRFLCLLPELTTIWTSDWCRAPRATT